MTEDWKAAVAAVAPTLATALGGPLAGLAASVAGRFLLGRDAATPTSVAEIAQVIPTLSPDGLVKLKEIEAELLRHERDLGFRFAELEVRDRERASRMADSDPHTPRILGIGVTVVWAAMMTALFYLTIPAENRELVSRGLGMIEGFVAAVFFFYFGSSAGSRSKENIIQQLQSRRDENRAGA